MLRMRNTEVLSRHAAPIMRFEFSPSPSYHYSGCPEKHPRIDRPYQPSETALARAFDLSCLGFPSRIYWSPPQLSASMPAMRRVPYVRTPLGLRNINAVVRFPTFLLRTSCRSNDRKTLFPNVKLPRTRIKSTERILFLSSHGSR